MRFYLISVFIVLCLLCSSVYSHGPSDRFDCGNDNLEEHFAQNPGAKERLLKIQEEISSFTTQNKLVTRGVDDLPILRVPVVWHVLYSTNLPGSRLSMESIEREMNYLNQWFNGENLYYDNVNPIFESVRATGADLRIQFEIASFDEFGNPTTGVEYRETSVAESCDDRLFFSSQGGLDIWDNSLFMNIYTCAIEGSTIAYSSFPFAHDPLTDATVMSYPIVGDPIYSGALFAHETGHYLGLLHTFEPAFGACGLGDLIDDTPSTPFPSYDYLDDIDNGCHVPYTGCGDNILMYQNVMDYTFAPCFSLFTKDQAAEMRFWLEVFGPRSSLISSIGLGTPNGCQTYDCNGKNCGDDGCGGLCGVCNEAGLESCNANQICELVPPCQTFDCTGKECGSDGCGGSCGTCDLGLSCDVNQECSATNEVCANAITIDVSQAGTYTGNNGGSTTPVSCGPDSLLKPVWYTFTSSQNTALIIDTEGSEYDTAISVFSGSSCNALSCVDYNDDVFYGYILTSIIYLEVDAFTTYYIAVGGYDSDSGYFELNITPTCLAYDCTDKQCGDDGCGGSCGSCGYGETCGVDFICDLNNDMCSTATPLSITSTTVTLHPFISDNDIDLFITCTIDGDDEDIYNPIWYSFTASATTVAIVTTNEGEYDVDYDIDTVIAIFSGTCGALTCIDFNDDSDAVKSYVEFPVTMNQQYFIAVGGFDDDEYGTFELKANLAPCANYDCDGNECGDDGCGGTCGTCGSGFVCDIFQDCEYMPCPTYDCDDKDCGDDGCGGSCGTCHSSQTCDVSQTCVSPNDVCATAMTILNYDSYEPQYQIGSTFNSVVEVDCNDETLDDPLWYTFTSQINGVMYADVLAFDFAAQIAVFRGNNCNSLQCIAYTDPFANTDISPIEGFVTFDIEVGMRYYVVVSTNSDEGEIQLQTQLLEITPDPSESASRTRTPSRTPTRIPASTSTASSTRAPVSNTPSRTRAVTSNTPTRTPVDDSTFFTFSFSSFTSFSSTSDSSDTSDSSNSSNSSSSDANIIQVSSILMISCLMIASFLF